MIVIATKNAWKEVSLVQLSRTATLAMDTNGDLEMENQQRIFVVVDDDIDVLDINCDRREENNSEVKLQWNFRYMIYNPQPVPRSAHHLQTSVMMIGWNRNC